MKKYSCYYGGDILMQSTIDEFDRCEGPRIITHISKSIHPLVSIWLKTYGSKSFIVQCHECDIERCIKDLRLGKT
jgi:hypothetical protein